MEGLKTQQIKNPYYTPLLGPFIKDFIDRVPMPGITYESLWMSLAQTIQHGEDMARRDQRDLAELWVVLEDVEDSQYGKPIAFAHWHVKPQPAVGVANCDYLFSWNRKKEPVKMLMAEFVRFASEHRCPMLTATLTNEAVFKVFKRVAENMDLNLQRSPTINVVVQR